MDNNFAEISELRSKVAAIITLLEKERAEKQTLKAEREELAKQNDMYAYKLSELEQQFKTLKTAKSITASAKDVQETKLRINKIVREIDKCIGMLNQ
jgi:hypothetical protein